MLLAYFPFTHVSKTVAEEINKFFGKFSVYQPIESLSSTLSENKLFDILIPDINYRSKIKLAVDEFYNWIYTNSGSNKIDFKVVESTFRKKPFYDDNSIEFIRHKIKNIDSQKVGEPPGDILFTSWFFLALAQYNDFYNDQLSLDIENFKVEERALAEILQDHDATGSNISKIKSFTNNSNSNEFMCSERIKAWSTIVLENETFPDFLITNNFSVLETLMQINFGVKILKTNPIRMTYSKGYENKKITKYLADIITQNDLSQHKLDCLEKLANTTNSTNKSDNSIKITVFVLPDISIKNFLIKLSPLKLQINAPKKINAKVSNTSIILIN